ncbi:MFS transporter, partial [Escherichia fergusonii]|uniref:Major facilitator superfamily (MFS) profile domain-containing protein n=1 Tax=Escherichia fergusonii (strain ATCC 35469 / DSM 13698 / CCUG 18766 / IAM 14443 / JCM 21226 / LMG 7866 / NBRC 102419 / NCTC 12128 / CDC 0568-73) TaxID=585054 RepID=B7LQH7_ESCF3
MGSSAALSMFWLLPPQFMSRAALAAGLGLISTFGSIASFVAPILIGWVRDTTNSSFLALYILSGAILFGAFLVYLTPKQYRPGGPQPLMPEEAKASS